MAENEDLDTLRAMARSQGIAGADDLDHDQLVEALRDAGLADGPPAPPNDADRGTGFYHGKGVGHRDVIGPTAD